MENIFNTFDLLVKKSERDTKNKNISSVYWIYGMSGSGKTTLASKLERFLFDNNISNIVVLDGDNLRNDINKNLSFSIEDRKENIRIASNIAKLYKNSGLIVLATFVTPTNELRSIARNIIDSNFYEIFIDCSNEILEQRDTKKLYKKAKEGLLNNFTGINQIFEKPSSPDLIINTEKNNKEENFLILKNFVLQKSNININTN